MIRSKNPPLISGTQFAAIVVLTIAIFLIIDFGRRTTAGYYVSQAEKRVRADIEAELALQEQLKERLDYVKSDAFVESWAREQAHMVRPGDQPLILITPATPLRQFDVTQSRELVVAATGAPNWHQWWQLFWDSEPGTFRSQ